MKPSQGFFLDLAAHALRMPISTDLVLAEKPDAEAIKLDGNRCQGGSLVRDGDVKILDRERGWLDSIQDSVETLPAESDEFIAQMVGVADTTKFVAADYELS
jgi:hypothetical protein